MTSGPATPPRNGFLVAVFGALPVVGYFAEVATGMFREQCCDLFPTRWHSFAVGLAVLLNLRLWAQREGNLGWRAASLGYVTGTALVYMLATVIDLKLILVAILIAGLGILALAPWWVGLGLLRLWPELVRDWRGAGRRPLHLVALALPTLLLVPTWIVTARIQDLRTASMVEAVANSRDPATAAAGLAWLRTAPIRTQEKLCAEGIRGDANAEGGHSLDWFVDAMRARPMSQALSAEDARAVFVERLLDQRFGAQGDVCAVVTASQINARDRLVSPSSGLTQVLADGRHRKHASPAAGQRAIVCSVGAGVQHADTCRGRRAMCRGISARSGDRNHSRNRVSGHTC